MSNLALQPADTPGMEWTDLIHGALSLLAPPCCPACDLPCDGPRPGFCAACGPLLERAPRAWSPPQPVAALYAYGGPLAEAIRRFKYGGRDDLAAPLSRLLLDAAPHYRGAVDCVVPVPLHPERLVERGFNQTALLGRPLARALGARLEPGLLRRVRPTRRQAGLPAAERLSNVRGAFAVSPAQGVHRRVLLVDDVRTSGATLAEAAACLRAHGFGERIQCLALAAVM